MRLGVSYTYRRGINCFEARVPSKHGFGEGGAGTEGGLPLLPAPPPCHGLTSAATLVRATLHVGDPLPRDGVCRLCLTVRLESTAKGQPSAAARPTHLFITCTRYRSTNFYTCVYILLNIGIVAESHRALCSCCIHYRLSQAYGALARESNNLATRTSHHYRTGTGTPAQNGFKK